MKALMNKKCWDRSACSACTWLALLAGYAGAGPGTGLAFGQSTVVESVRVGGPGQFNPVDDGPPARMLPPGMPNLAEIPPMPMPEGARYQSTNRVSGVTIYDMSTGEATELPVTIVPNEDGQMMRGGEAYRGADGGPGSEPVDSGNFLNSMSQSNPQAYPPRVNCKVAMRFGTSWFVCSGTMIGPETVLTAGHCVNDFGGAGWANEVYVFPGWEGLGTITPPAGAGANAAPYNFYGYGRATGQLIAGSNWVNSGDNSADMANIGLDRSVGFLTGWHAYEWDGSCGFAQGVTWNNQSYPAEGCGTAGLHNGRDMYFRTGSPNSCPTGTRLQFDTSPGCFGAVWGGMSGSSLYELDGATRRAYAVCSTSNRTTSGTWCKLWGAYVTDMQAWINTTVRTNTFDLEALDANFSGSVAAGGNFSLRNFLVANPTNANPGNATYTYRVYLSTNDNISSSDTLLGTYTFTHDFAALEDLRVNIGTVTVPGAVAPGNYWVGVVLDPATDANSVNDNTVTWDAMPVTVTAAVPANNSCIAATAIFPGGTYFGSNEGSTLDGATNCGAFNAALQRDVWYEFTPACTSVYTLDTEGSNDLTDTVISVHASCPGTAGNTIECDDDDGTGFLSSITRTFFAGTTYVIRVTGYNGALGAFQLNLTGPDNSNNFCVDAIDLSLSVQRNFSTCLATNSPWQTEACLSSDLGADLWYRYVADYSGPARVDTCDTGNGTYDTLLAVYDSCPSAANTTIACNDDACGLRSRARFNVTAGQDYIIRVGGFNGARGNGIIAVEEDCDSIDFNRDGVFPSTEDITDFLRVFSGGLCTDGTLCNSDIDFNNDGVSPSTDDIDAFLRMLAGGRCYLP